MMYAGGYDIPLVMGSKSTYLNAGIGTPIQKNDIIYGFNTKTRSHGIGLIPSSRPKYEQDITVRVILGPEINHFTDEGICNFFTKKHKVSPHSNRMGYCLQTLAIKHKNGADITSDVIPFGSIQVPANGQPIIMMADRQTTGGYTRIATVISVDLPKITQIRPGGTIGFRKVSLKEAQKLARQQELGFSKITNQCK